MMSHRLLTSSVALLTILSVFDMASAKASHACLDETEQIIALSHAVNSYTINNYALVLPDGDTVSLSGCLIPDEHESFAACDYDAAEHSAGFEDACVDAGGQLTTTDVTLTCGENSVMRKTSGRFEYTFLNLPACVGASCSIPDIKDITDDMFMGLARTFGDNVTCEVKEDVTISWSASRDVEVSSSSVITSSSTVLFALISSTALILSAVVC